MYSDEGGQSGSNAYLRLLHDYEAVRLKLLY
jgi:hypothetical protein